MLHSNLPLSSSCSSSNQATESWVKDDPVTLLTTARASAYRLRAKGAAGMHVMPQIVGYTLCSARNLRTIKHYLYLVREDEVEKKKCDLKSPLCCSFVRAGVWRWITGGELLTLERSALAAEHTLVLSFFLNFVLQDGEGALLSA